MIRIIDVIWYSKGSLKAWCVGGIPVEFFISLTFYFQTWLWWRSWYFWLYWSPARPDQQVRPNNTSGHQTRPPAAGEDHTSHALFQLSKCQYYYKGQTSLRSLVPVSSPSIALNLQLPTAQPSVTAPRWEPQTREGPLDVWSLSFRFKDMDTMAVLVVSTISLRTLMVNRNQSS